MSSSAIVKNWSPPPYKIKAQEMIDAFVAAHPELLNMTFHGKPPSADVYTMFAGTFPERIGKVSSMHDIFVIEDGLISVGVRYKETDDPKKVVVMLPLKDSSGQDIAVVVFAFRDVSNSEKAHGYFVSFAMQLRDDLFREISSYSELFEKI